MFVYACVHLPVPPQEQNVTQSQFWAEFDWFEFRDFILLDGLPAKAKNLVCLTIYS